MRTVYLDYNATTPIAPAVQEAMLPFLAEHFGDPAGAHALGRACQEALEDARLRVGRLLGAQRDEIVFTSGGTESNNLAVVGTALRHGPAASGHLVLSAVEHASVLEPARFLESLGYGLTIVGCDVRGRVDPETVEMAIRPDTVLVSVAHAGDELGVIQPIGPIAQVCRRHGVVFHVDAVQTAGKTPLNVDTLGVDLLSISGHKMYAPKGIGALYVRRGTALEPILHGAGHEQGLRSGTENVPGAIALGHACSLVGEHVVEAADRMILLRDRLAHRLSESVGEELTFNGSSGERLPNTLSVNFPGVSAQRLLARLPELCASTGSSSHSGSDNLSPTLAAIGLTPRLARGTVRLSLGWYTAEDEIERAADLLLSAWEAMRGDEGMRG